MIAFFLAMIYSKCYTDYALNLVLQGVWRKWGLMIGLGIDIIEIDRINKAMSKNNRFLEKIFTEYERSYFISKGSKAETIAGIFAAKEAVSKVLGKGIVGYTWQDIEITHDNNGKPVVSLKNGASNQADALNIKEIMVSISHCKTYAVANAAGV